MFILPFLLSFLSLSLHSAQAMEQNFRFLQQSTDTLSVIEQSVIQETNVLHIMNKVDARIEQLISNFRYFTNNYIQRLKKIRTEYWKNHCFLMYRIDFRRQEMTVENVVYKCEHLKEIIMMNFQTKEIVKGLLQKRRDGLKDDSEKGQDLIRTQIQKIENIKLNQSDMKVDNWAKKNINKIHFCTKAEYDFILKIERANLIELEHSRAELIQKGLSLDSLLQRLILQLNGSNLLRQNIKNTKARQTAQELVEKVRGSFPIIDAPKLLTYGEVYSLFVPELSLLGESSFVEFGNYKIVTPLYGEPSQNKIGEITSRLGGLGNFNSQMSHLDSFLIFTSLFVSGETRDDLPLEFKNNAYQAAAFILPLPEKDNFPQTNYVLYLVKKTNSSVLHFVDSTSPLSDK
jgi:hypothetical protein